MCIYFNISHTYLKYIFKTDCSSSHTSYFSPIFEYFGRFGRVYKLVLSHNSIYALRIHSVRTLFMAATFTCASHAAEQLQQQRGRWRRRHLNGATTTMAAATTCLSPTKNAKSMRHNRKSKSINGNDKAREKLIEWQTCKVLVWKWRRLNARDGGGGAVRGVVVWQVYKNVLTAG